LLELSRRTDALGRRGFSRIRAFPSVGTRKEQELVEPKVRFTYVCSRVPELG
jgi:hypothetical protein